MSFEDYCALPTPNFDYSFSEDFFIRKENLYVSKFKKNYKRSIQLSTYSESFSNLELSGVDENQCQINSTYGSINSTMSFLEKLGEGSFGDVFLVRDDADDNFYAVKRIKKRKLCVNADGYPRFREINNIHTIGEHVNLVRLICFWEDYTFMFMQFDLCSFTLSDFISTHGPVVVSDIWWILKDICTGLNHIHHKDFVHLDIKPANLFFSLDHKIVKIGDFGLLFHLSDLSQNASEGDNIYMAPELLTRTFSKPADIFSLGLTILELLTNLDLPKQGILWHKLRQEILPPVLTKFPFTIISLITNMLKSMPENRIALNEIIFICNYEMSTLTSQNTKFYTRTSLMLLVFYILSLFDLFFKNPCYYIWKKMFHLVTHMSNGYCPSSLTCPKASHRISQCRSDPEIYSEFNHVPNSSSILTSTPNQNNSYPYIIDNANSFQVEKVKHLPANNYNSLDQPPYFPRKLNFD